MPFGCLALRDGRTYHSLSDITEKYEIGQVLKAKEFCELCLIKERQTSKVYVCKKFLKKDGRKVRKAAKNEIMILKMVDHTNILKLIDAFETRKEFYIIQELATGGDVFDWILDQGNYTERDAANVIRQVLEAVAYLHSLNIVHRNLKLENLMYYTENNHNKVVLRDFYLSRFENGSITEPCGTPEYLAPEVVARHRYGRPVDCWAVGVIMFMLLSGNPPFYDETEEENTDMHNRIIFCRIVAGDYEFDSPYWDDISPAAKELVCRLMEVDQMLRITAQDALWHEWISGNGASEKNLKDGVCAQFEKNFAKAKWRKAIRVTTFMQRLRASEMGSTEGTTGERQGDGVKADGGENESASLSHEVTLENTPVDNPEEKTAQMEIDTRSFSETIKPFDQIDSSTQTQEEKEDKAKKPTADGSRTASGAEGQVKASVGAGQKLNSTVPTKSTDYPRNNLNTETDKKASPSDIPNQHKTATDVPLDHGTTVGSPSLEKEQSGIKGKVAAAGKQMSPGSWCQTQIPEAVAERQVGSGMVGEISLIGREGDGELAEKLGMQVPTKVSSSSSKGQNKTVYVQEKKDLGQGASCGNPFCSPYSVSTGAAYDDLEQEEDASAKMDSAIEEIEKQMVAVLERIEGDMPSLLGQIRDCPESLPRAKSAQSSPSFGHRSYQHHSTPPPLPTTPRPAMPSLPHLTIPPPSYPPPNPPTQSQSHNQPAAEQD